MKVGLALGGGVVRGMAHIGVVSALEEAGIPIDYIAGTSAGSIIAVTVAAGIGADRLRVYGEKFSWLRLVRPVLPLRGFFSFSGLARLLVQELGDLRFEDLKIPCTVVAVDMQTGLPVRLSQGRIAPAVQGSCSVPGFFTPVELDGHLLCDGATADMIPVDALREMGADYVIGVDIFPFKLRRWLGPLGYFLAALEILLERSGGGFSTADCMISPDLSGKTYLRFSKRMELYELGRLATLEKLDAIREALGLEPSRSGASVETPSAIFTA